MGLPHREIRAEYSPARPASVGEAVRLRSLDCQRPSEDTSPVRGTEPSALRTDVREHGRTAARSGARGAPRGGSGGFAVLVAGVSAWRNYRLERRRARSRGPARFLRDNSPRPLDRITGIWRRCDARGVLDEDSSPLGRTAVDLVVGRETSQSPVELAPACRSRAHWVSTPQREASLRGGTLCLRRRYRPRRRERDLTGPTSTIPSHSYHRARQGRTSGRGARATQRGEYPKHDPMRPTGDGKVR